ncbi:urease accessory protein UreF [Microbispora sp. NBC_01189]|uniref:urease accessory protein UreF n=1 Tax=Microbispora sp. NBC_01189 TaxID=2903583 RepID=UPI002E12C77F|nr:urease accessory protein UreF [Microbispora sp. NBC_01189]
MDGMRGDPAALLLLADSRLPAGGHAHSGGVEEAVRLGTVTDVDDLARFLRGRLATAGLVTAALSAAACELAAAEDVRRRLWRRLDDEADARTASPAQREAARTQGRLLLRTARRLWPSAALDTLARAIPEGPHHPIALGAAAASAGCEPQQAALAAAYTSVTGPATAAVRLLGLDPVTVHRLLADLAPALNDAAHAACASLMDTVLTEPVRTDTVLMDGEPMDTRITDTTPTTPALNDPAGDSDPLPGDAPGSARTEWRGGWAGLPGHSAPALDLLAEGHLANPMKLFVS